MAKTLKKENGDIVIQESNGRPYKIGGIEKLTQEVADCLMVTYDPERDFGHELDQIMGNGTRMSFLNVINSAYIKNRVEEAVQRLKSLQKQRPDQIDNFEAIDKISDIKVYAIGATEYVFIVDVAPVAGPDKNPLTFEVKLAHQLLNTARRDLPGMDKSDKR
jgi:hypothetical protein